MRPELAHLDPRRAARLPAGAASPRSPASPTGAGILQARLDLGHRSGRPPRARAGCSGVLADHGQSSRRLAMLPVVHAPRTCRRCPTSPCSGRRRRAPMTRRRRAGRPARRRRAAAVDLPPRPARAPRRRHRRADRPLPRGAGARPAAPCRCDRAAASPDAGSLPVRSCRRAARPAALPHPGPGRGGHHADDEQDAPAWTEHGRGTLARHRCSPRSTTRRPPRCGPRWTRSRRPRGQTLFAEGDPGDRLYVIIDGKIKLGARPRDGRENLLAVLGPGEMFGELSLFDPGPRTATATAVTDAHADRARPRRPAALAQPAGPRSPSSCSRPWPGGCAAPTRRWPTSSSATCPAGWPRRCSTSRGGSACRPTTACGSPTTSPRRSSPSWWAPPARPSTRRWPTSPAAGCSGSRRRAVVILDVERLSPPGRLDRPTRTHRRRPAIKDRRAG